MTARDSSVGVQESSAGNQKLSDLIGAYRDVEQPEDQGEYVVPSVWTPAHVVHRLISAYDVLRRTPVKVWPKGFATAWPAYVYDDEDRKGQEVLARVALPALREVTLAEEALCWCFDYLQHQPAWADGLQLYCWCSAYGASIAKTLRMRRVDTDKLVEEARDRQIDQALLARRRAVDPKVAVRQQGMRRLADDRRRALAAEVAAWANKRLAQARDADHANRIKANARIRLEREIAAEELDIKVRVTRQDVVPNKVFTKRWLDVCRKSGAQEISTRLIRARIEVR